MGFTWAGAEGSEAHLPGLRIDDLKPGQELQGVVQKVVGDVGIFVDVGAERPGLVPRNKLLEGFCANAEERKVEPGDRVKVWVCVATPRKFILSMVESKAPTLDGSTRETKDLTSFKEMSPSQWVTGTVTAITTYGAFVAVCPPSGDKELQTVGLVHKREIKDAPVSDVKAELSVDQEVQVRVIGVDTKAGTLSLSMKSNNQVDSGFSAFEAVDRKAWLTGHVDSTSSFGAFIVVSPPGEEVKLKGLLHTSQMNEQARNNSLVKGQEVQVRVLNVNTPEKRLELTMKEGSKMGTPKPDLRVFEGASKEQWRAGRVESLANFGLFVSLPQPGTGVKVTGLVPRAETSNEYVADVGDLFEVGQEVQVRILSVDTKAGRLALTMKEPGEKTKKADIAEFSNATANTWFDGRVETILNFGAFVQLKAPSGGMARGLVHISQIKDGFLDSIESELKVGQKVSVRILSVDVDSSKINLSMRETPAGSTGEV